MRIDPCCPWHSGTSKMSAVGRMRQVNKHPVCGTTPTTISGSPRSDCTPDVVALTRSHMAGALSGALIAGARRAQRRGRSHARTAAYGTRGDRTVERFLRGIEIVHDQERLAALLLEGHGVDRPTVIPSSFVQARRECGVT